MFAQRLKELRKNEKLTQEKLADAIGIDRSNIAKWETTDSLPSIETLKQIAAYFDVTLDYLMGFEKNVEWVDTTIKLAIYGSIPAGVPIEAITEIIEYIDIPARNLKEGKEYFGLKVVGSSMFPEYVHGDYVIIERNPECQSGQDCALYINGYDVTLKRVLKQETGLLLQPLNPEYNPVFYPYDGDESVTILGIVRGVLRFL